MSEYHERVKAAARLIAEIPVQVAAAGAMDGWGREPEGVVPTALNMYTAQCILEKLDEYEYSVQMTDPILSGQWLKFGAWTDKIMEAHKRMERAKNNQAPYTTFRVVKRRKAGKVEEV